MLIDTHCHLTHGRLRSQLPAVLERAASADVTRVIAAGATVADSAAAREVSRRFPAVYFTAGVHPHEAKDTQADYMARLAELAGDGRCVAVGEIGLDYHYDFSPRECQRRIFAEQLDLAGRLGKPIVVHTREALDDTLAILREAGAGGERLVFHSFTGGADETRRILETGASVGYSGIATFKKADDIRRGAALAGPERILVETDAPYLSPEPVRGMKVNEPANVVHVAACLAAALGIAPEALAERTTANAVRVFSLDTAG